MVLSYSRPGLGVLRPPLFCMIVPLQVCRLQVPSRPPSVAPSARPLFVYSICIATGTRISAGCVILRCSFSGVSVGLGRAGSVAGALAVRASIFKLPRLPPWSAPPRSDAAVTDGAAFLDWSSGGGTALCSRRPGSPGSLAHQRLGGGGGRRPSPRRGPLTEAAHGFGPGHSVACQPEYPAVLREPAASEAAAPPPRPASGSWSIRVMNELPQEAQLEWQGRPRPASEHTRQVAAPSGAGLRRKQQRSAATSGQ